MESISSEVFCQLYGSVVRQLITDLEDIEEVNKQLDTMGYNIGVRIIDEFLAKSKTTKCTDFRDTADKIAKVGLRMFLNCSASATNWNADSTECSLILDDNLLIDFVELPEGCQALKYCNILCGVIRGALEMVNISVECNLVKDTLKGDDVTEIRLRLLSQGTETYPFKDDD